MSPVPTQTLCIGRLLVDAPAPARLRWTQETDVRFRRLDIEERAAYDAYVSREEARYRQLPHKTEGTLLSNVQRPAEGWHVLFVRRNHLDGVGHKVAGYAWKGGNAYEIETLKYEREAFEDVATTLVASLPELRRVDDGESAEGPGFCIDHAVADPRGGRIMAGLSIESFALRGVSLSLGVVENHASNPESSAAEGAFASLSEQEQQYRERMRSSGEDSIRDFKVLRREQKSVMGLSGEEGAYRVETSDGKVKYGFVWTSQSRPDGRFPMALSASLEAGADEHVDDYTPPPDEEQLTALWDALLASIKERPGAY
ncbi:T6SS immunity protein Tli4 family protein [Luteimonas abyssi]|uniref:T6SS immunity protein Tli4 family protein n=1 Tax=Luteimonas abyssi TaxID=1247514 RepID=UPI0012FA85D7|nr:T6SS immunity protein Tli4 family protein [Luteimonas abyssi]